VANGWSCGKSTTEPPFATGGSAGAAATTGGALSGGAATTGGALSGGAGGVTAGSSNAGGSPSVGGGAANGGSASLAGMAGAAASDAASRSRTLITNEWRFTQGDPSESTNLGYPAARAWVLPSGNAFLKDTIKHERPTGNLGDGVAYVAATFDDASWQRVELPHDYAIAGPFTDSISSSMGSLPSPGVAWYRKRLAIPASQAGKSVFLELDGAMSYSMVWVNGQFVGGWPYGYSSFSLNLTPHIQAGQDNVIAVRLDNPTPASPNSDDGSSRWYPGAGIYRNVWLTLTEPVHVAQWGVQVTTPEVSAAIATVRLDVSVANDSADTATVSIATELFEVDAAGAQQGAAVATSTLAELTVPAGATATATASAALKNPKLWGPPPQYKPNRYVAVTKVSQQGKVVDVYETRFGVRTIKFDGFGFTLNGKLMKLNGVCNHHDLGALGTAINARALERQFQILTEMGTNALRTAHNPPAPELLEIADRLGFLILDEAFDVWATGKTKLDHHLFFDDWHEQDLRALIRRDRNHPSVVMWSIGNEVVEQNDSTAGPAIGKRLTDIAHEEDPTRPTVQGMNAAKSDNPFSKPIDTIGLNYQGTGLRRGPAEYRAYHLAYPNKFVVGTETTSTFSSRGVYSFPVVTDKLGTPASSSAGILNDQISSYDLYHAEWSYSPDAEFESQERHPWVGGEFVWTGFDHLGGPSPLEGTARSSYSGILDLAGFKKDRFFLYQARWRPEHATAHILPHWTWPERTGEVTPVHVYTSGDEAELFLNGTSLGRKKKAQYSYRLRWDDVLYQPGELSVVTYKNGEEWARNKVATAGAAAKLTLTADRAMISADGKDLAFVTLAVEDQDGNLVPRAMDPIRFELSGAGEIVATDNGNPLDRTEFHAQQRAAFNGKALAIVRAQPGKPGELVLSATATGLISAKVSLTAQ